MRDEREQSLLVFNETCTEVSFMQEHEIGYKRDHTESKSSWLVRGGIILGVVAAFVLIAFGARFIRNRIRLAELRKTYPQYFDLDANKGLLIYVNVKRKYSERGKEEKELRCTVMEGYNLYAVNQDAVAERMKNAVSVDDMRLILSTYDIPEHGAKVEFYNDLMSSLLSSSHDPNPMTSDDLWKLFFQ